MKKALASILSLALVLMVFASTSFAAETNSFTDINNSYAKDAILDLQAKGILNGIDAEHFNPKGALTRAQFVAIIVRSLGIDVDKNAVSSFSDVSGWEVPYVEAAFKAGIITGAGNGKFGPNDTVTREMSVTILVRALQTKGAVDETATLDFTDADKISDWAKKYVAIAQKIGLIKGNPDGTFNPQGNANREMAAVMGTNLLTVIETIITPPAPVPSPSPSPSPTTPPPVGCGSCGGGGGPTPDTTKPITTLIGAATVEVENGTAYTDAGATATDTKDGEITANIVTTTTDSDGKMITSIDTKVAGTYTFHFNVSDAAKNAAVEVTRTVKVFAVGPVIGGHTTIPVISQVYDNPGIGKEGGFGDYIDANFSVDKKLSYLDVTAYAGDPAIDQTVPSLKVTGQFKDKTIIELSTSYAEANDIDGNEWAPNSTSQLNTFFTALRTATSPKVKIVAKDEEGNPTTKIIDLVVNVVADFTKPVIGHHLTIAAYAQVYDGYNSDPDGFGDYIDTNLSVNEPLQSLKVFAYAGDPDGANTPMVEVTGKVEDITQVGYSTSYAEANDTPGGAGWAPNTTAQLETFFKALNTAINPKIKIVATDMAGNVATFITDLIIAFTPAQPTTTPPSDTTTVDQAPSTDAPVDAAPSDSTTTKLVVTP